MEKEYLSNLTPPKRTKGFQHFNRGIEDIIGLEGEKIFAEYLKTKGIKLGNQADRTLWWRLNRYYTEQRYDFIINNYTIDIKTIDSSSYKQRFLFPIFEKIKCQFYVGIKLPNRICGYLTSKEVFNLPIDYFGHCNARWIYLDDMNNIEELMNTILKNKNIINQMPSKKIIG